MVVSSPRTEFSRPQLGEIGLDSVSFVERHIGPSPGEVQQMLDVLGLPTLDTLINQTVPQAIRLNRPLQLRAERSEHAALAELKKNRF